MTITVALRTKDVPNLIQLLVRNCEKLRLFAFYCNIFRKLSFRGKVEEEKVFQLQSTKDMAKLKSEIQNVF